VTDARNTRWSSWTSPARSTRSHRQDEVHRTTRPRRKFQRSNTWTSGKEGERSKRRWKQRRRRSPRPNPADVDPVRINNAAAGHGRRPLGSIMWAALEQKPLRAYNDLERQMGEPAVLGQSTRFTKVVKGTRPLARSSSRTRRFSNSSAISKPKKWSSRRDRPRDARLRRGRTRGLRTKHAQIAHANGRLAAGKHDEDSTANRRNPGRHRRPTRRRYFARFVRNVHPLRREQGWKVEEIAFSPGEAGGSRKWCSA